MSASHQAPIAPTAASRQTAMTTVRRSIRSEMRPIGSCVTQPARMATAMNIETSKVVKPSPSA